MKYGAHRSMIRINDPDNLVNPLILEGEAVRLLNPEMAMAREITRIISTPVAEGVEVFAKGKVELLKLMVTSKAQIKGHSLKDIELPASWIFIGHIGRDGFRIPAGDTVLDLGCGAGMDAILAARCVGPGGKIIGVDMVEEMVLKGKKNVEALGLRNVCFHCADAENIPVGDGSVDVLISNGVFNLCFDKPRVVAEMYRVLRMGGCVQMADILLEKDLPPEEVARKGTWSD